MCREPVFRLPPATATNLAVTVNIKNAIQSEKVGEISNFLTLVVAGAKTPFLPMNSPIPSPTLSNSISERIRLEGPWFEVEKAASP